MILLKNFEIFALLVQAVKESRQKLLQICLTPWEDN